MIQKGDFVTPRATTKKRRKPGPRPRGPYVNKRRTFSTKITEETRRYLEERAALNDRSLSQEIEFILDKSRSAFDELGGESAYKIWKSFVGLAQVAESFKGKPWTSDKDTFTLASYLWTGTIRRSFDSEMPTGIALLTELVEGKDQDLEAHAVTQKISKALENLEVPAKRSERQSN